MDVEQDVEILETARALIDNVIASPHTAGVTNEARRNMGRIAAEQILATLDGRCPPRLINPQAWLKYSARFERAFGFRPDALKM